MRLNQVSQWLAAMAWLQVACLVSGFTNELRDCQSITDNSERVDGELSVKEAIDCSGEPKVSGDEDLRSAS